MSKTRLQRAMYALGAGPMDRIVNTAEMRELARTRLPRAVFEGIDGGGEDEVSLRANAEATKRVWLRPRALADVQDRDISTTILGDEVSMPLMLAPCGFSRMCDSEAELAVVRAAGAAGAAFALSGAGSATLEEVAEAATGPLWYQLYMGFDLDDVEALLARVADAGYRVLCVTIDISVVPKRDRDVANRLEVPLRLSPQLIAAGISRPLWTKDFVLGRVGRGQGFGAARTAYWNLTTALRERRSVTFEDLAWLRERWPGPLVVKGVMRGDEVPRMAEVGVDGVVVSNHGGRNLDTSRGTYAVLPEVVEAAAGRMEVFVDGGVRRGSDVVKALALGAQACLIGRPYLYGLSVGGEAGVARVLEILRVEIDKAMGLAGCSRVDEIDRSIAMVEGIDGPMLSSFEGQATRALPGVPGPR